MNKADKEELLKEIDRRLKVLRDEFISKLEDDKKEFELTYPNDKELIYYISAVDATVRDRTFYCSDEADMSLFEHGLYFNSKEEAEEFLKERKLLFKLHQWAKMKNDGWEPDWSNGDAKFYLWYDFEDEKFREGVGFCCNQFNRLPYFKSSEIVQECIELFEDEIKEVLC